MNRPPEAVVGSPGNGDELQSWRAHALLSLSSDPDGQELTQTWVSDVDGVLGSGPEVLARLSEGEHVLTLRVEDPLGGVNEAIVRVEVVRYSVGEGLWWPVLVLVVAVVVAFILWYGYRHRTLRG